MTPLPRPSVLRIDTLDAHVAGEPLRVITGGWPEPEGDTILAKRRFAEREQDALRRATMLEPRGHADMYGCLPVAPERDDGDVGVLFLHNAGFSTMCGHGIIGFVTAAVEEGRLEARAPIRIDTPAGRVTAVPELDGDGRVTSVAFENVPSFVVAPEVAVEVEGIGRVRCDVAFGGAFYAYVEAASVGLALVPEQLARIVDTGMRIKRAVAAQVELRHPSGASELEFVYGTIFVGRPASTGTSVHSRNVCVFADGEVDRSPTGTGVSGRAALHHARGELAAGEWITIESLIGTTFDVRVARTTPLGSTPAVVPEVRGRGWLVGRGELWIDPEDPLREGFLLRRGAR